MQKQLKEGKVGRYSLLQQESQGSLKEVVRWCLQEEESGNACAHKQGHSKETTKLAAPWFGNKVCIVDKKERTSRGIGKSVETREMEADWTWPGLSGREARWVKNSKNRAGAGEILAITDRANGSLGRGKSVSCNSQGASLWSWSGGGEKALKCTEGF